MAKSLQEIEKDFHNQFQQKDLKVEPKEEKPKENKLLLISNIIFAIALIGGTLSAILLYWGGKNDYSGNIYTMFNGHREVILIGLVVLTIVSFILKFMGNGEKIND